MIRDVPVRITTVWALLTIATCVTWWLGAGHGAGDLAILSLIAIAFAKVYLIGSEFMELRGAPVVLRAIFTIWTVVVALGASTLALI